MREHYGNKQAPPSLFRLTPINALYSELFNTKDVRCQDNHYWEVARVTFFKRFYNDDSGATAIEYGILIALLATAVVVGAGLLGGNLTDKWDGVKDEVEAH